MIRVWQRWAPAAVAAVVVTAGALSIPLQAGAAVDLPDKTPHEVMTMVGESTVRSLSGTVEQTSNLGLPDLSAGGSHAIEGAASALELLTGSHTLRVFVDGPDKSRVQVLDGLAERDMIRNGSDVWFWDFRKNTATHLAVPENDTSDLVKPDDARTPGTLAQHFLDAVDTSTTVTVDKDTQVAGRSAYDLVLTPRSKDTLVGSVSIAVDSETGLPLRVQVTARGETEPAFQVEFTKLNLQTPNADLFSFEPPPGATVKEQALPERAAKDDHQPGNDASARDFPGDVSGTGWDSVIELPAGTASDELTSSPLFAQVTEAVDGGRVLSTTLMNVLITGDGRIFAGSVPLERLQSAATDG
ncbi:MAG: sigma-E factor regulatory protein RseB domain-containing protein [Cryobacterium sp.]